jgi:plasmid stabilization system protein ParE
MTLRVVFRPAARAEFDGAALGEIRCVRARRFPYSVFYRVEGDQIVVLAVFHARRDPIIWQVRA